MCLPFFISYPRAIASAVASSDASVNVVAPMSFNTSLALRPSTLVPFILKKSSSATVESATKTLPLDIPVDKVAVVVIGVPFKVIASASNVPSISAFPDISKVAASSSPVKVTFLKPVISLFTSTTAAFDAEIVPAVTSSIDSKSFSFILAFPIIKLSAVTEPLTVVLPLASKNTALAAGNVQNIVLVPALQLTALPELELANIVVLAKVVPEAVNVPN